MMTSFLLWGLGDTIAQKVVERKPSMDIDRLTKTAVFGAGFMGPVGHFWYIGLDKWARSVFLPGTPAFFAAKVFVDSFVLGPIYVLAFYAWGAAAIDRTGFEGFRDKVKKDFIPTFAAELSIWPLFQSFNFTRIPIEHQLLAVNFMTLLDASFLSWARTQEDWVATVSEAVKEKLPESLRSCLPSKSVASTSATTSSSSASSSEGTAPSASSSARIKDARSTVHRTIIKTAAAEDKPSFSSKVK